MKDAELEARAEAIHDELGIDAPEHIDITFLCAYFGLFARYRHLGEQEGHLARHGSRQGVVHVAEKARGSYQWRFTLAHELAHWVLHHQLDDFVRCLGIGRGKSSSSPYEREADTFASMFLLPRVLFAPLCTHARPTLGDVSALSDIFQVSLMATALRYLRFAVSPCAIVFTREGRVEWSKRSKSFVSPLAKNHVLGGAAFARLLFAGETAPDALLHVDPVAWRLPRDLDLHEHTRPIGRTAALSLLWHPAR
jgi:Zn-dependent peptidase ImmA (M78 family)